MKLFGLGRNACTAFCFFIHAVGMYCLAYQYEEI